MRVPDGAGRNTRPTSVRTQVQSLGQWPTGCLTLDTLLTLSEAPCAPQLIRWWREQSLEWHGQASSIHTLKLWAPPRARPAANCSSQILGEAHQLYPCCTWLQISHVCKLATTGLGRPLEMLIARCQ